MVLSVYSRLQKFSIIPNSTLVSMEDNKEATININLEDSSGCFCYINKSLGHRHHLKNILSVKRGHCLWSGKNNMIVQCAEICLLHSAKQTSLNGFQSTVLQVSQHLTKNQYFHFKLHYDFSSKVFGTLSKRQ